MCKYLAFKGAPNSNFHVQVPDFQRDPQQQLLCVSTMHSTEPHHHLQCANEENRQTNLYNYSI